MTARLMGFGGRLQKNISVPGDLSPACPSAMRHPHGQRGHGGARPAIGCLDEHGTALQHTWRRL